MDVKGDAKDAFPTQQNFLTLTKVYNSRNVLHTHPTDDYISPSEYGLTLLMITFLLVHYTHPTPSN